MDECHGKDDPETLQGAWAIDIPSGIISTHFLLTTYREFLAKDKRPVQPNAFHRSALPTTSWHDISRESAKGGGLSKPKTMNANL